MIFTNYEYFIAIAEDGSISKAAEKLYISQPSLSKYLKNLEKKVGVALFERTARSMRLTAEGQLFLKYVKEVAQREKRLLRDFEDVRNTESGTVSLALTVWRSSIVLPAVLPSFKAIHPNIDVVVYEGSHQYMASLFEKDKIDFAIFHKPNRYNNVTFEHLMNEKILFCVNTQNPLLAGLSSAKDDSPYATMTNEEFLRFSQEPLILLQTGQNIRDITQNYLNKLQIAPQIVLETSNIVTALNAAKAGLGVTFVPETMLSVLEQSQKLRFFSVDNPPLTWEIGIAYHTENILSKQAQLLVEHIKKCQLFSDSSLPA